MEDSTKTDASAEANENYQQALSDGAAPATAVEIGVHTHEVATKIGEANHDAAQSVDALTTEEIENFAERLR